MLITIKFKKNNKLDYKVVSRQIRNSKTFGIFVKGKSKDRTELYMDFSGHNGEVMKDLFITSLEKMGVVFEIN